MKDLTDRIERIARKLEDPDTCEWVSCYTEDDIVQKSEKEIWWRQDEDDDSPQLSGTTAGWLIECLWRAEVLVRPGYNSVWVEHDGHVASPTSILSGDLLLAVVKATERALGITP